MDPAHGRRSVALIGMMGSGKTTVGALLAARIGWTFLDTDLMLEATFHRPIGRIFAGAGEDTFRRAERMVVRLLMSARDTVIATGGGLWLSEDTRRRLRSFAWTAYLAAPANVLWERVRAGGAGQRPLLAGPDPRRQLADLLAAREPVYARADWQIDASVKPQVIVSQLLNRMASAGLVAPPGRAA